MLSIIVGGKGDNFGDGGGGFVFTGSGGSATPLVVAGGAMALTLPGRPSRWWAARGTG